MSWSSELSGAHNDLIAFAVSAAMLLGYQLFLRVKLRGNPTYTIQAVNALARTAWVECVMRERKDILAVQTLRNSTMAATFLASTAVLLIMGVLTLSAQGDRLGEVWHALNLLGAKHSSLWMAKLLLLLLDLFIVFFAFSMSIRVYNHIGFMINVPLAAHKTISPEHVALHLNRGGRFYSIGMRAFYYTVPLVFWLFDPMLMFASTLALIIVLFKLDRTPRVMETDYS